MSNIATYFFIWATGRYTLTVVFLALRRFGFLHLSNSSYSLRLSYGTYSIVAIVHGGILLL
ncbi:hypothetical protein F5Y04DRAFT_248611 [Hypomontagnella monticulosa]|nr:hypothetical protein F5Y04DRAFT_248611 [Hypomontagnella monticulosa]